MKPAKIQQIGAFELGGFGSCCSEFRHRKGIANCSDSALNPSSEIRSLRRSTIRFGLVGRVVFGVPIPPRHSAKRSSAEQPLPKIETSELIVDFEMRMVTVRGDSVHLTPKEFDVLRLLVTQEGRPVTHRKILQIVWGPEYGEETEPVRVVIRQLRKKIEKNPAHPRYILTEPWVGYMFQLPPDMAEKRPLRKV